MQETDWKAKSIAKTADNKQLKKRIKELIESRDNWKNKASNYKKQAEKLESDLKKIKNRLNEIIK
jgi:chaperonin cofactor prefoldin